MEVCASKDLAAAAPKLPWDDKFVSERARYWMELKKIQPDFKIWAKGSKWLSIKDAACEKIIKTPELHRERLECELVIDLDNKSLKLNKVRALEVQKFLFDKWNVPSNLWFSGNKGFHIHSFVRNATRRQLIGLFFRVNCYARTRIDRGVMEHARHMIRGEYSLHSKSGFVKVPVADGIVRPVTCELQKVWLEDCDRIVEAEKLDIKKSPRQRWASP